MTKLLLDTNVVIWLLVGDRDAISATAARALEHPRSQLFVSAASVWEIALKRSRHRRLTLAADWREELARLPFEPLPVNSEHAKAIEDLPPLHGDPFDRMLVAQSIVEDLPLVTADAQLPDYPAETIW